jgi:Na+:H+ antiporter
MDAHEILLQLMLILIAARIFAECANMMQIPPVIGELVAGIILGPSLLGWITPNEVIKLLAEIGIIMLLFEIGLETNFDHLLNVGSKAVIVALGGFILPFILGFFLCYSVFHLSLLASMFIGGTLTATSIGITMRILSDLGIQHGQSGQIVLGAAVLDDVLGVILLSVLYDFSINRSWNLEHIGTIGLFIGSFFLLAPVAAKFLSVIIKHFDAKTDIPGLIPTTVVSLVLFFAWLANTFGAPEILGGFAAGLALSRRFFLPLGVLLSADSNFAQRVGQQMKPIVQLFAPIFFVLVGLSLDLHTIEWSEPFIWLLSLSLTVVAVIGKFGGVLLIKEPWEIRALTGMAMVPRGEVGLIFAELGRASNVFSNDIYASLILVIVYTTLLSPFWIKLFHKLLQHRLGE